MLHLPRNTIYVFSNQFVRCMSHTPRASKTVDRILRVDHAGELGADRIYAGQMAVLGKISEIFKKLTESVADTC